ncbi:MAG: protein phosphatase CheZ [Deltaproteobacteria bacterium]|jgi:chemotaxis protein CheZ|nr:protein phosphatase CheZ [Deltaproteobacteria bacterium]
MVRSGGNRAESLKRLREEKEFHKKLNEDMLQGLRNIYKEIAQLAPGVSGEGAPRSGDDATGIFHELSRHLEEAMLTTLQAADDIMNRAEALQENQDTEEKFLLALRGHGEGKAKIDEILALLRADKETVTSIVTALSFQDLTGQHLKKVVQALESIRRIVVQTYVSAGLMLKKSEDEPEKNLELIAEESRKSALDTVSAGSELRGPVLGSSQKDVDDLLSKLGF